MFSYLKTPDFLYTCDLKKSTGTILSPSAQEPEGGDQGITSVGGFQNFLH